MPPLPVITLGSREWAKCKKQAEKMTSVPSLVFTGGHVVTELLDYRERPLL